MRKEENCNSERFEKANMQDVIDAPQQVQTRSQEWRTYTQTHNDMTDSNQSIQHCQQKQDMGQRIWPHGEFEKEKEKTREDKVTSRAE